MRSLESADKNNKITRHGPALGGRIGARPDCGPIGAEVRPAKRGLESEKTSRRITNDLDIAGVSEGRKGTLSAHRQRFPRAREALQNPIPAEETMIFPNNGAHLLYLNPRDPPHAWTEPDQA